MPFSLMAWSRSGPLAHNVQKDTTEVDQADTALWFCLFELFVIAMPGNLSEVHYNQLVCP